ncbi:MAG: hypothetical protein QW262_08360 [Candidatus Bathyarchaeia archaeon]
MFSWGMVAMRIAIVYYSRTGYTERVVGELGLCLKSEGFTVDVYRTLPIREYSKPLHLNPRLIYDTLIRGGTDIRFEPSEPRLSGYSAVIVASPIWIGTLTPPIQEFLRRYAIIRPVIIITSIQSTKTEKIERIVERLCRAKPLLCVNIKDATIKDPVKLKELIKDIAKRLKATMEKSGIY